MHLHLGKTRITKTIALTTAGLATAGLLAAAVALLPPGSAASGPAATLTLTGQDSAAGTATPTSTSVPQPAPTASVGPTTGAEASGTEAATPAATEPTTATTEPETGPVTELDADSALTPRQSWLAQQQLVRECMAAEGHEYLYFEWWNRADDHDPADYSNPALPDGLTPAQEDAWASALDGDAGTGADYRWQDAGCWGAIVEQLGRTN
ncbi:hypothetical protein D6T64_19705 [Cryobacterium melibiosiphilum]|uniref:Uncharacterized protein n=1 Tax=Cryobacterium melibiosiphilum TaxID=995039 RepID=A0A3A5MC61_9MICO|nr:hypothetical protein [Cryobacterium melibiosiphilum]RJT85164.1 hypothetical protein D6T64_19705 [Cryobacterium melibiosiphilum]